MLVARTANNRSRAAMEFNGKQNRGELEVPGGVVTGVRITQGNPAWKVVAAETN